MVGQKFFICQLIIGDLRQRRGFRFFVHENLEKITRLRGVEVVGECVYLGIDNGTHLFRDEGGYMVAALDEHVMYPQP